MPLKKVRGFPDHLPKDNEQLDSLLSLILEVLHKFDFQRVNPPLLEYSELFSRTLGETSDIVNKEMYSFQKGEDSLTLRPEGTASIARIVITEKMSQKRPLKWYYHGPMFRHERPQKGRFRQFHQVGLEFLGDFSEQADVEILSTAWLILKKLGLEKKVTLEINSLGSLKERQKYKEDLRAYLQPLKDKLSPESQLRLVKNPLRIWDSKDKKDREIMKQAPILKNYLQKDTLEKYQNIQELLAFLEIPFCENPFLVRGLDYYNDLVFEFHSRDLGAQSTFLAGGRYDHLIESLGGEPSPATGWALGLERLSLLVEPFKKQPLDLGFVAVGERASKQAFKMAYELRSEGFAVYYRFSGNFSKQMKRVGEKCLFALIYGERELAKGEIILKNLQNGEQSTFPLAQLQEEVKKRLVIRA